MNRNGSSVAQLERPDEPQTGLIKVGILAGGGGTRLAEESDVRPKPMVEIGGRPILWHIMMHYARYGFKDFAVALGYRGDMVKRYMLDYCALNTNLSVHFGEGRVEREGNPVDDWNVDLIDTGQETMTGGRIKRLRDYLGDGTFMLTWGDGVSDVDLHELLKFHRSHGRLATVTAVRPPARFGRLEMSGDQVTDFAEKPQLAEGWINGAFFVLEPGAFDYIAGDETQWEKEPLERLARDGELMAYKHAGFWQCMDTLRDRKLLETMWAAGNAPWKTWA